MDVLIRRFLWFIALFFPILTNGQSFKILDFSSSFNDLSAQTESRLDFNGVKCGLVKVRCVLDGVSFKGNVIGDVEYSDGEYWVYLSKGSKSVTVCHANYLPYDIDFEIVFGTQIKSANTYILTLSEEDERRNSVINIEDVKLEIFTKLDDKNRYVEGFKNWDGEIIIPAKYWSVYNFSNGVAAAKPLDNDKFGFINPIGMMVIPAIYDRVTPFNKGISAVCLNDKWGLIDIRGNYIVTPQYDEIMYERDAEIRPSFKENGKWGVLDYNGHVIIPALYDTWVYFYGNYARAEKDGKSGIIDLSNNVIIPFEYEDTEPFEEGLASVKYNGKWGFVNDENKFVIPPIYDYVWSFENNFAIVRNNDGKEGIINKSGDIIVPFLYDDLNNFSEGLAGFKRCHRNGKMGFVDSFNNIKISPIYENEYPSTFSEGRALVKLNDKYGFIDISGNLVIEPIYDWSEEMFKNGKVKVGIGDIENRIYYYINQFGEVVN